MDTSSVVTDTTFITQTSVVAGAVTAAQIQPYHTFGVNQAVKNNLLFVDQDTVIFPTGNHCVSYAIHQDSIKFLYSVTEKNGIQILALSRNRRYLAVSGKHALDTNISIFDLKDELCGKIQVLKGCDELVCIAFSPDTKYLLAQSAAPLWTLDCWDWKQHKVIFTLNSTKIGEISQVSFNPEDDSQICVSGNRVFKVIEMKYDTLKQATAYDVENENVLCHAWMSAGCLVAGTESGKLLMLKSKTLLQLETPYDSQVQKKGLNTSLTSASPVTTITPFSKGFACSAGQGFVCLYKETINKDSYKMTMEIRIPEEANPNQAIATMCITPEGNTLGISTDQGQLYQINFDFANIGEEAQFEYLLHSLHSDSITGLSLCPSKPLIATCAKDFTVHIWNFKNMSLEHFKLFDNEPISVSMHPNGLAILVGFSTEVCLMKLANGKIRFVNKFPISDCTECVFNNDANLFAAVCKNMIYLYNLRTQEKRDLKGHLRRVHLVRWSYDDRRLVSCGLDGGIYMWDVLTGDYLTQGNTDIIYIDIIFSPSFETIFAADHTHIVEISDLGTELKTTTDKGHLAPTHSAHMNYTAISLTSSGQTIFTGTAAGSVRVYGFPFETFVEHEAHSAPITKMAVTPSDQYLLTTSQDGSIFIWLITNEHGRTLERVTDVDYAEEVLYAKSYLEEKDQAISELESQNQWLKLEQEYRMNEKEMEHSKSMNKIRQNYIQQIGTLKNQIEMLNFEKKEQAISFEKEIKETKEAHAKTQKDMELNHAKSLTAEYERIVPLEQTIDRLHKNHEKKLHHMMDSNERATKAMKQSYEDKLQALQNQLEQNTKDFEERMMKIKVNAEVELTNCCNKYEQDLLMEKEEKMKFKRDMNVMMDNISQYHSLKRKVEEHELTIKKMKEEEKKLRDHLWDANNSIKDLKAKTIEQSKTINQRETHITNLKVKIKELDENLEMKQLKLDEIFKEKQKYSKERFLMDEKARNEIIRLENELNEKKEQLKQKDEEVKLAQGKDKVLIENLKQKQIAQAKALQTEKTKVRNQQRILQRMKEDVHKCAQCIQNPKVLKETFVKIYKLYVADADVTTILEMDKKEEELEEKYKQIEQLEKIIDAEKSRRVKEIKAENSRYTRMMKESSFLIDQLKQHKADHQELLADLKKRKIDFKDKTSPVIRVKPKPMDEDQSQDLAQQIS